MLLHSPYRKSKTWGSKNKLTICHWLSWIAPAYWANTLLVCYSLDNDGLFIVFVVTLYFKYLIIMNSFSIDYNSTDHKELIWHYHECHMHLYEFSYKSKLINMIKYYCFAILQYFFMYLWCFFLPQQVKSSRKSRFSLEDKSNFINGNWEICL